jgi:predicted transcriptional regulator
MAETVTLSVNMPRAAMERLDALARSLGRTPDHVASEAIASYLDANDWQVAAVRSAVETADAGGSFYANEEVMRYLKERAHGQQPRRPKPIAGS